MNEHENEILENEDDAMNSFEINLGSDDFDEIDDPFAVPEEFLEEKPQTTKSEDNIQIKENNPQEITQAPLNNNFFNDPDLNSEDLEKELSAPQKKKTSNPLEAAVADSDNALETAKCQNIFAKLPQFDYSGVQEEIEDTNKTFETLRSEKSDDFPELQDKAKVSWKMEYGAVIQPIVNPEKKTIAEIKSEIESSKKFLDGLKKAKTPAEKDPICKVKPVVTAQKKGKMPSAYKGVFTNLEEAKEADKPISIVPGKDGNVYEIRKTELGIFTTPTKNHKELSDIRAGFIPALPKISWDLLWEIIFFFKDISQKNQSEVLINIYWDKQTEKFVADCPYQVVSGVSVDAIPSNEYQNDRYIHYMDIHSHNTMKAFFSRTDDNDEKATRVYGVVGKLDRFIPDIKIRISNGGNFHEIPLNTIFGSVDKPSAHYDLWMNRISKNTAVKKIMVELSDKLYSITEASEEEKNTGGEDHEYFCK